jgi:hypothetical protein
VIEIPLTQGKVALVDDCDAYLAAVHWHAAKHRGTFYAKREVKDGGRGRTVYLHRAVMGEPPGVKVDHKDGNGLDCRRANVRAATSAQNGWNRGPSRKSTSGFRGVYWYGSSWGARVIANRRSYFVGAFESASDAAVAFDVAARLLHGQFAHTNFGPDHPIPPLVRVKVAMRLARMARRSSEAVGFIEKPEDAP